MRFRSLRFISALSLALPLAAALLFAPLAPRAAQAQQTGEAAIPDVISRQIEAFRAGDMATAFTFASPGLQRYFVSPEYFGQMVLGGYQMVTNPQEMRFLDRRAQDGRIVQRLFVRGADGREYMLDYHMIEAEGRWRINGVNILPVPDVGV